MGGQTSPRNYQYLGPPQKGLYTKAWEWYNDLLYKCPTHDINNHQKVNIFYKGLSTMNRQLLDLQGPIPGMRPAQALIAIQIMAVHSQKWHDGTTSRNIRSSSSKDRLAVLLNKLQENAEINTRNQNTSLKNLETQIEQLTLELCSIKEKSEQAKVVIVEYEGPSSPKKIKYLRGISFLSDSQEENTNDQLLTKESNPGNFTLP
ncbi:hypothetical protein Tco_0455863 [Tanacetum coccineum]